MHGPLLATPARWGGKAEFTIADEATETLPDEYCDEQSLIAPPDCIGERYNACADSGATGLTISTPPEQALELMADLAGARSQNSL